MVVAMLANAPVAQAQGTGKPVSQADVSGTIGWLNADKAVLDSYRGSNDWYNRSLYGGADFGWYWTDHWKTTIEGGVSSRAKLSAYSSTVVDGRPATLYSTYGFVTRRLAIGQQYQFYRNVWVHPFVGGGVDLTWEETDRSDDFLSTLPYGPRTAYPRRTEFLARPFTTFGLKAYMTPRAFFRTDLKLVFDKGVDEALVRFGLGVDF